jgi:hypothetical protein
MGAPQPARARLTDSPATAEPDARASGLLGGKLARSSSLPTPPTLYLPSQPTLHPLPPNPGRLPHATHLPSHTSPRAYPTPRTSYPGHLPYTRRPRSPTLHPSHHPSQAAYPIPPSQPTLHQLPTGTRSPPRRPTLCPHFVRRLSPVVGQPVSRSVVRWSPSLPTLSPAPNQPTLSHTSHTQSHQQRHTQPAYPIPHQRQPHTPSRPPEATTQAAYPTPQQTQPPEDLAAHLRPNSPTLHLPPGSDSRRSHHQHNHLLPVRPARRRTPASSRWEI